MTHIVTYLNKDTMMWINRMDGHPTWQDLHVVSYRKKLDATEHACKISKSNSIKHKILDEYDVESPCECSGSI